MIHLKTFEGIPTPMAADASELLFHKIDDDLEKWIYTHRLDEFSKNELITISGKFNDFPDLYIGMVYDDANTLHLHKSKDNFLTKKYMVKIESIEDIDSKVGEYSGKSDIYIIHVSTSPTFDIRKYNDEWFVITCRETRFLCDSIDGVFQFIDQKIWRSQSGSSHVGP